MGAIVDLHGFQGVNLSVGAVPLGAAFGFPGGFCLRSVLCCDTTTSSRALGLIPPGHRLTRLPISPRRSSAKTLRTLINRKAPETGCVSVEPVASTGPYATEPATVAQAADGEGWGWVLGGRERSHRFQVMGPGWDGDAVQQAGAQRAVVLQPLDR